MSPFGRKLSKSQRTELMSRATRCGQMEKDLMGPRYDQIWVLDDGQIIMIRSSSYCGRSHTAFLWPSIDAIKKYNAGVIEEANNPQHILAEIYEKDSFTEEAIQTGIRRFYANLGLEVRDQEGGLGDIARVNDVLKTMQTDELQNRAFFGDAAYFIGDLIRRGVGGRRYASQQVEGKLADVSDGSCSHFVRTWHTTTENRSSGDLDSK